METREALVALNLVEGVGPVRVRQLLEHFGDAPAILRASRSQLLQVRGIGDDTADTLVNWEKTGKLATELKNISDFGCHVVIQSDPEYPELLKEIYDPPIVNDVPICKQPPSTGLIFSHFVCGSNYPFVHECRLLPTRALFNNCRRASYR